MLFSQVALSSVDRRGLFACFSSITRARAFASLMRASVTGWVWSRAGRASSPSPTRKVSCMRPKNSAMASGS